MSIIAKHEMLVLETFSMVKTYIDEIDTLKLISKSIKHIKPKELKNRTNAVIYLMILEHLVDSILARRHVDAEFEDIIKECESPETMRPIEKIKVFLNKSCMPSRRDTIKSIFESLAIEEMLNEHADAIIEAKANTISLAEYSDKMKRVSECIKSFNKGLNNIGRHMKETHTFILSADVGRMQGVDNLKEESDRNKKYTIHTGSDACDQILLGGGMRPSEFTMLASFPGGGKSLTMLAWMIGAGIDPRNKVLFESIKKEKKKIPAFLMLSYENTKLQTFKRILNYFGINTDYFNSLRPEVAAAQLRTLFSEVIGVDIIVESPPSKSHSANDIREIIEDYEERGYEILLCLHDYIGLSVPNDATAKTNDFQEVGTVATEIREVVCKEKSIHLVSAAQIKKEYIETYEQAKKRGDHVPSYVFNDNAIYGGNILSQKADNFIFVVYDKSEPRKPYFEFVLNKQRDGGNAIKIFTEDEIEEADESLRDTLRKQNEFNTILNNELTANKTNYRIEDFLGKSGKPGVIIPAKGIKIDPTLAYASRYNIIRGTTAGEEGDITGMFGDLDTLKKECDLENVAEDLEKNPELVQLPEGADPSLFI